MTKEFSEAIYADLTNDELNYILKSTKIKLNELASRINVNLSTLYRWRKQEIIPIIINRELCGLLYEDLLVQIRLNYKRRNANK